MTCGANVAVFCRTYDGDIEWLEWTLPQNLERMDGFGEYVVVGIGNECDKTRKLCEKHGVRFEEDNLAANIPNGYINQQFTKLRADLFCQDADYVLFVDSDTVATDHVTPDALMEDGNPVLLYTDWEHVGDAKCWREPTKNALAQDPPAEFMRRLPLLYRTDTIRAFRSFLELTHEMPLLQYIGKVSAISEFNVLGAYAWFYENCVYKFVDTTKEEFSPIPFKQFWSWGNMKEQLDEWEK